MRPCRAFPRRCLIAVARAHRHGVRRDPTRSDEARGRRSERGRADSSAARRERRAGRTRQRLPPTAVVDDAMTAAVRDESLRRGEIAIGDVARRAHRDVAAGASAGDVTGSRSRPEALDERPGARAEPGATRSRRATVQESRRARGRPAADATWPSAQACGEPDCGEEMRRGSSTRAYARRRRCEPSARRMREAELVQLRHRRIRRRRRMPRSTSVDSDGRAERRPVEARRRPSTR